MHVSFIILYTLRKLKEKEIQNQNLKREYYSLIKKIEMFKINQEKEKESNRKYATMSTNYTHSNLFSDKDNKKIFNPIRNEEHCRNKLSIDITKSNSLNSTNIVSARQTMK